jgi:ribosomal protein S18 acetylase RimI-like enzyme
MGMGQLLLNHAILLAQKVNTQLIWLGVWEHNNKAISFYQKNGFEAFGQKVFMLGEDHQNDLLMRLKLL